MGALTPFAIVLAAFVFVGFLVYFFTKKLTDTARSSGVSETKEAVAKEQAVQNEKDNIVRGRVRNSADYAELVRTRRSKDKPE